MRPVRTCISMNTYQLIIVRAMLIYNTVVMVIILRHYLCAMGLKGTML